MENMPFGRISARLSGKLYYGWEIHLQTTHGPLPAIFVYHNHNLMYFCTSRLLMTVKEDVTFIIWQTFSVLNGEVDPHKNEEFPKTF